MKTTITVSVDGEVKEKAMSIIQRKMNKSVSGLVNDMLISIVNMDQEKSGDNNETSNSETDAAY